MLKKLKSDNLFSFESHEDTSGEDLPEQGVVTEADAESVVAEATPSEDVTEAGDDVGQATPNDEIEASPEADITTTEDVVESTDSADTETVTESEEVNKLTEEGEQAAAVKDEIVATATAELTGESDDVDVNGNSITPEQAAENAEEDQIEEEIDEDAEKTAADKDLNEQVEDVTENVDEELSEAIGDDSTDGGLDAESTDDTSTDIDSVGDQGDLGMDAEAGDLGDVEGGDDVEFDDDDTPLEGAEDVDSTTDVSADDSAGDVGTDETDTGSDMDTVESDDGGDLGGEETVDDTSGVDDGSSVADDVEKQNEAADVTAEAASADADQTEFIAGDTPEQHGEEPSTDELPVNDGEEVVAEAEPAIQNQSDVGSDNADLDATASTADEVDFEDDTPLEGAETSEEVDEVEPLEVNAEQDLTPTEVDGQEATGPTGDGATVEESQSDQQAEELDAETTTEESDDSGDDVEETETTEVETEDGETETETEEVEDITSDGEPGIDAEAGEIEVTDEEADLEEGELDIPDVDTETTEEEVEEAEIEADEVEAEADAEEAEGDIADKTIEELQKEKESLEKFCVMLRWGIANESYNPGLLAYMVAESDNIRGVLNDIGFKVKAVSLESYDAKDMDLAYQATLESFRGMLSRMSTISHQLTQKVERWWAKGMVDKVKARTNALNKQIDLCLVQLKDSDKSTQEVNAIGAYLAHADGNLVKAVSDDLKAITDIGGKGFKATEELQSNLVKALNDITAAASPAEATSVADKVSRLKDTKSAFPSKAFTPGLLGGYRLELKDAKSGDALKDKILNMGRRAVPVVVREGKGNKTSQKLSKGDVSNLLKMAKAYVALADKLADTTGDRAVDNVSKIRLTRERALPIGVEGRVRGGDEAAIDAAASALEMIAKAHNDLYKFVTKHCIDVADALCGVAKKFTK